MKKLLYTIPVLILAVAALVAQPNVGPIVPGPADPNIFVARNNGLATNLTVYSPLTVYDSSDPENVIFTVPSGGTSVTLSGIGITLVGAGVITTSQGGSDIRSLERYQFANRATTSVDNTTAETTLTNSTGSGTTTIAADYFATGTVMDVSASGTFANFEGGETVTFRLKLTTTAILTIATAVDADGRWRIHTTTTVRSNGGTGSFFTELCGQLNGVAVLDGETMAVDTTTAHVVNLTCANDSNNDTVTCDSLIVKIIRP